MYKTITAAGGSSDRSVNERRNDTNRDGGPGRDVTAADGLRVCIEN